MGQAQDPTSPYSGVISIFIDNLINKRKVLVNGGYQTRDFIYVSDVVSILLKSMYKLNQSPSFHVMNVGTGVSTTINKLLMLISEKLDVRPEIIRKKLPIGDPELSTGQYQKTQKVLNINLDKLCILKSGISKTIEKIIKDK